MAGWSRGRQQEGRRMAQDYRMVVHNSSRPYRRNRLCKNSRHPLRAGAVSLEAEMGRLLPKSSAPSLMLSALVMVALVQV